MSHAQLHYVLPRGKKAIRASVECHPDKMRADLSAWHEQIARDNGTTTDDLTVIASTGGEYLAHLGPWTFYRKAAAKRAGLIVPGHEPTYYEKVRDQVERLAECTTSDAQGIIGAWEMKNGNRDPMEDVNIDKAESAGTDAEELARTILNMPGTEAGAHTPGPWSVGDFGGHSIQAPPTPYNSDGLIASVRYLGNSGARIAEYDANAALIATSPRMLKALRWALTCVPFPSDCHAEIAATIEQATGKRPA